MEKKFRRQDTSLTVIVEQTKGYIRKSAIYNRRGIRSKEYNSKTKRSRKAMPCEGIVQCMMEDEFYVRIFVE